MEPKDLLAKYDRMHAYFMADPRFWYEKGRQEADKLVCVLASNLRHDSKRMLADSRTTEDR